MADFDIADVAEILGIRFLERGNSFGVVCPYCRDTRGKMNFCIRKNGELKNTFHCFACGASGNMLTLYADLTGLYGPDRYKQAYQNIQKELKHSSCYHSTNSVCNQPKNNSLYSRQKEETKKAAPAEIDHTYRMLLSLLFLSQKHHAELRRRGLDDAQISAFGARTIPGEGAERYAGQLIRLGCTVKGVPGFYLNCRKNWDIAFPKSSGFLYPIPDEDGRFCAIQMRMDQVVKGRKYLWLSGSKYPAGVSSGSPAAFYGSFEKELNVTEGALKAYCAHCLTGEAFCGIAGAGQAKSLKGCLENHAGKLAVNEYLDMDKYMSVDCRLDEKECAQCPYRGKNSAAECPKKVLKRTGIRQGCNLLYQLCEEHKVSCRRKVWNLNENGIWNGSEKGIDDYLLKKYRQKERL